MIITTEIIFWTQVSSIITFVIALFWLYRVLVEQKEATIQLHKEHIIYLNEKLTDAKSQSPDSLVKILSDRIHISEEELNRLKQDKDSTQEQLKKLQEQVSEQVKEKKIESSKLQDELKEKEIELSKFQDKLKEKEIELKQFQCQVKEQLDSKEVELNQLRELSKQLTYLFENDSLTGIYNRTKFSNIARDTLNNAHINNKKLAFLIIDIDYFKNINDSYGHSFGDQLLIAFVKRLQEILGNDVLFARLGGDEFSSIIEYDNPSMIEAILTKLIDTISMPFLIEDKEISITASIGVSLYPEHGNIFENLLYVSDEALYQAKIQGRGRYVFFSPH